jgi:sterol 14-demethylase
LVSGIALLGLLLRVFRKGPEAAIEGLHAKLGDVFTVSFLFGQKVTFLIGQEVLSEISRGDLFECNDPG